MASSPDARRHDDDLREGMLADGTWPDGSRRGALAGQDPNHGEHHDAGQLKPKACLQEVEGEDWPAGTEPGNLIIKSACQVMQAWVQQR